MVNKKIKEIYNCEAISSSEPLYPLQKWYNQLIEKSVDHLSIVDVLRMLRQNLFTDLAMTTAIKFLKEDAFAGEVYDGEILERLSEKERSFLKPHAEELRAIVKDVSRKRITHEWAYDGEDLEFKEMLDILTDKIM